MPSIPQTYTVSDFVEWHSKRQLVLDPNFQRGSVWSQTAKVFLIDTILNDLPMPQVYFRTKLNPTTQSTIREVVDGQQRLRAVLEFASGKLRLTSKSPQFKGKTYQDLTADDQERFLSYRIPVVQLINANDGEVLEIFARLNSYSVKVTPAELRHAEFSEPIKWAIYDAARDWAVLWSELKVINTRDTVRMKHTSLMAEMFMSLDRGIGDGGEAQITKYYKANLETTEEYFAILRAKLDSIIEEILLHTRHDFCDTVFYDAPNFLMLFATVAFLKGQMPISRVSEDVASYVNCGVNWGSSSSSLSAIVQAFEFEDQEDGPFFEFVNATKSTTHRISSRKIRFSILTKLLAKDASISPTA